MRKKKAGVKMLAWALTIGMILTLRGFSGLPGLSEVNAVRAAEREMPENPVHECTKDDAGSEAEKAGSDKTKWSRVYFGNYPQSEVIGYALTAEITGASYDAAGDAWVNGEKYRRVMKNNEEEEASFGEGDYRYFKWEPIKWRVLRKSENTLFVIADQALDYKIYHEPGGPVTWENCELREWLNNEFYETAFSSAEQGAVAAQTVVNADNPYFGTEGGNDTIDKVFFLSLSEALNPEYGFCENDEAWSFSRRVKASAYAKIKGVSTSASGVYKNSCYVTLRSPGYTTSDVAGIFVSGVVNRHGSISNGNGGACVPALHINLSSDCWSLAKDGVFTYQSGNKNYTADYYYTDDYFEKSSYTYNHSLATMSLCFAMSAFGSGKGTDYPDKSENAQELLKKLGFDEDEIKVNEDFKVKPTADSIGAIAGIKPIRANNKDYTLVALAIRGSGYEQEWASNFTIGTSGQHAGFSKAKNEVVRFLQEYLAEEKAKGKIPGDVKFWVTGFSRAAATANLVGAKLNDGINGVSYLGEDVYTYCFETPAGGLKGQTERGFYENIYNIINPNDPVPYVAPAAMGFRQYGKKLYLPSAETLSGDKYTTEKEKMLKIYNSLQSAKSYGVDEFKMKKLTVKNWLPGGKKVSVTVQNDSKNRMSQGGFLSEYVTIIAKDFIGSRENYTAKYQQNIREICSIYFGNEQDKTDLLVDNFTVLAKENWGSLLGSCLWNSNANPVGGTAEDALKIVSEWLIQAMKEAGITGYSEQTIRDAGVKLAELLIVLAVCHPKYLTTAIGNVKSLGQAHYPELCYAWMASMDENYVSGGRAKAVFTNGAFRLIRVNCEVDVTVTDADGNAVASIQNDEPRDIEGSSIISSVNEDGEKVIILPPDLDYRICITGRADEKVNYAVSEYCAGEGDFTRLVNYFDVDLKRGESLEGDIPSYTDSELESDTPEGSDANYLLYNSEHEEMQADSDLSGEEAEAAYYRVTVKTSNERQGVTLGSGIRQYGSFAQVEAAANEGYLFKGWYLKNQLVSEEASYRFAVTEDTELTAEFEKDPDFNSGLGDEEVKPPKDDESEKEESGKNESQENSTKENISGEIVPKGTAIKGKVKAKIKSFLVKWKKQTGVSGYQIQYSTDKKFKKKGTGIKTVNKPAASKLTVKKLKAGKKYYVRIRTYKTVNGTRRYSAWSKSKSVRTKIALSV